MFISYAARSKQEFFDMEKFETILKIAVADSAGKEHYLEFTETVARAVREKLNTIFGPDRVTIKEYVAIPQIGGLGAPAPAQDPNSTPFPYWHGPTITCGKT